MGSFQSGRQSSDEGHQKTKNKSVQLNPKTGEVILLKGEKKCSRTVLRCI